MKVAVVILNWNGAALLRKFLPAVIRYSPEASIYVADNNSDDESIQVLASMFPSVTIIRNSGNFGFARGYNEALKSVAEPYYALVNSDVEVTEGWLQPVTDTFDAQATVGIIQPKILDHKDKAKFEYAGAGGGYIDKYGYPFCRGRVFDTIESDTGQYDDERDIFWATGACFFIRREIYHQLGGFDESFFAHQEEIDLCWRAFNSDVICRYIPKSVVYHVGGATLQQGNPRKTFLNFRNSLLMLAKNVPRGSLIRILLIRLVLDGIAGVQMLLKGKPRHCLEIIKAHFAFYAMAPAAMKKRRRTMKRDYYIINSVVYSYFIKGRRTFSCLL